jgi:hypothetical protein
MSGRISLGGTSTNPAAYGASTQYSSADLYPIPAKSILRPEDPPRVVRCERLLTAVLSVSVLILFALAGVLLNLR